MRKNIICSTLAAAFALSLAPFASAGEMVTYDKSVVAPAAEVDPWADTRRPISNLTLFDLAVPQTTIHPFFLYHRLPAHLNTTLGSVPVGGSVEAYGVQVEIALTERLSINATKDGYVRFRPDATLSREDGFANIGAGLKYAWLYQPENKLASSIQLIYEIPTGSSRVLQSHGNGLLIPSINVVKLWDKLQFADQLGFKIPLDGDVNSATFHNSAHLSYAITDWLFPTFEVNWFATLDEGDGGSRFQSQVGGAVPGITNFEAHELFNLGASNGKRNKHLVTMAVGARARLCAYADLGFGWEFPVTSDNDSVIRDRFYVDAVLRF